MKNCIKVNTPIEYGVKMSKNNEEDKINSTTFKNLVGSLRYLTCIIPYILFRVGFVRKFIETLTITHLKALKRIIQYIKDTIDFDLFYEYSNNFELVDYSDINWSEDMDDRKRTTCFVFYMGNTIFTWSLKKQHIVTLSTCEAKYVGTTTCIYHFIWLRRLLKELRIPQEKPVEIYVDNSAVIITLANNQVFHDKN